MRLVRLKDKSGECGLIHLSSVSVTSEKDYNENPLYSRPLLFEITIFCINRLAWGWGLYRQTGEVGKYWETLLFFFLHSDVSDFVTLITVSHDLVSGSWYCAWGGILGQFGANNKNIDYCQTEKVSEAWCKRIHTRSTCQGPLGTNCFISLPLWMFVAYL